MGNFDAYGSEASNSITLSLTQDCQLRCKYCYMVNKNNKNAMTFEIAKKSIDYILSARDIYSFNAVQWEFIGGEPLLEIDLLDRICDYIKQKTYVLKHPWATNYMFNISTNGILYSDPKVQNFIKKNRSHLSVGISLDGNKEKHDNQRVYGDNSGSYDDVVKNVPLWLEQFPNASTKATFSHGDIHLLKDSIIHLWELGIRDVAANVVFEDVWDENDPILFENQLKELADYVIDNKLWNKYNVRFFDPNIGFPQTEEQHKSKFCGAGKMVAIDNKGDLYPCTRFMDFTLNNKPGLKVGNIRSGVDKNKLKPFEKLTINTISPKKCLECDVASGCASCSGNNYDCSKYNSVFERSTAICEMHKANVRACEYFWDKLSRIENIQSDRDRIRKIKELENAKFLQIITSDNITSTCNYNKPNDYKVNYKEEINIDKAIDFAEKNGFKPVILGDVSNNENLKGYTNITDSKSNSYDFIKVYEINNINENNNDNIIININRDNIGEICNSIKSAIGSLNFLRVNLMFNDLENWTNNDVELYANQLDDTINLIVEENEKGVNIEINVLSNINFETDNVLGCGAGIDLFALAPNKKIYLCPAFYFNNKDMHIGDIYTGIDHERISLFKKNLNLLCNGDKIGSSKKCIYCNQKQTSELYISSDIQRYITEVEIEKAKILVNKIAL